MNLFTGAIVRWLKACNPAGRAVAVALWFAATAHAQDGVVRFTSASVTVSEGVGIVIVELARTSPGTGAQVAFQSVAQTAVAGVDFHPVGETYAFDADDLTVPLAIQIFDNPQREADRQFKLTLSNPVNLTLGSPAEIVITIADNDETHTPGRGAAGTNIFQGIYALGTNSSGAIVAGGNFRTFNGSPRNHLARVLPSGELDATFTPGSGPDRQVWAVGVQPDDRLLIGGEFQTIDGTPRARVARLTDSGTVDPTFDPGTGADDVVESIELQGNGQILIGGRFTNYNGIARPDVALLNTDGTLDETFNAVTPASFFGDVARRHGEHILVGGFVAGPGANVQNSLMRFNLSGVRDAAFQVSVGDIFFNQVYDIVVQPDLKILIAGSFFGVNGVPSSGVARLNANGTFDNGFNVGAGANDTVIRLHRQADGRLITAGVFLTFAGVPRSGIARLNSNGSLDLTFDPGRGANDFVYNALPLADGGTLAVGAFSQFDGYDRFRLAVLDADGALVTEPLRLFSPPAGPAAGVRLEMSVEPGRDFRLLTSTTLTNWTPVLTNWTARRSFELNRPAAAPREFFRLEQAFTAP